MAPQSGLSYPSGAAGTGLGVHDTIRGPQNVLTSFKMRINSEVLGQKMLQYIMLMYFSLHQHSHRRWFLVFVVGEALTECPGRGSGRSWVPPRAPPAQTPGGPSEMRPVNRPARRPIRSEQ